MSDPEYKKMHDQERSYWWFQGRKYILFRILERFDLLSRKDIKTVDIGCGTGLILESISRKTTALGLDYSNMALSYCRERGLNNLLRADVTKLPIKDASVDLFLALDILEHIENDKALLGEIYRGLKPGGHLLATVPAHQSLWSEHDEALHHFRRYSKKDFETRVRGQGFKIRKSSYVITFTYLPIFIFRKIQNIFRKIFPSRKEPKSHLIFLPKAINSLLINILKLEGRMVEKSNLPFGVSILCLVKKPDGEN